MSGPVRPGATVVPLDVIAVPDPESVHDRVHLDLATTSLSHRSELVARLTKLGAVGRGDMLADPEGNVSRVLEPRSTHRDTGPIAAVVVSCADPRAMARFWGEAMDWTVHEVTDDRARLRALGATDLDVGQGDVPWHCLSDPEGNPFCVLTPS